MPADAAFLGELALDGTLRPVSGVLPMALAAAEYGIRALYVPEMCIRDRCNGAHIQGVGYQIHDHDQQRTLGQLPGAGAIEDVYKRQGRGCATR